MVELDSSVRRFRLPDGTLPRGARHEAAAHFLPQYLHCYNTTQIQMKPPQFEGLPSRSPTLGRYARSLRLRLEILNPPIAVGNSPLLLKMLQIPAGSKRFMVFL